jgi:hypothetical protein
MCQCIESAPAAWAEEREAKAGTEPPIPPVIKARLRARWHASVGSSCARSPPSDACAAVCEWFSSTWLSSEEPRVLTVAAKLSGE